MFAIFSNNRKVQMCEVEVTGFKYVSEMGHFDRLYGIDKSICSEEVRTLATNTAGGHIRIRTNSKRLNVCVKLDKFIGYSHFTVCGTSGLDVYIGNGKEKRWIANIIPDYGQINLEKEILLPGIMQDITINLPLYTGVDNIEILIERGAKIEKPTGLKHERPIIFYGSSITQGCSASRPGNSYPEIVARKLDASLMNFGFSSGAKGENYIAEYIAALPMTAMVIEYDHNARDVEELKNSHLRFVQSVRSQQPMIPLVLMSRFSAGVSVDIEETIKRRDIIKDTYTTLKQSGDKNIYFIDGFVEMKDKHIEDYFIDGVHPTDRGMYFIAGKIEKILSQVL